MRPLRRLAAAVLATVGLAAGGVAVTAAWADRVLFDSARFAERAADSLESDDVRRLLAREITDQVVTQVPAQARVLAPPVERGVAEVMATDQFAAVFERAVRFTHARMVEDDAAPVVVDLSGASTLIRDRVRALSPTAAEAIPDVDLSRVPIGEHGDFPNLARLNDLVGGLWPTAAALAVVALGAALVIAPDRARLVRGAGLATAGASGLVLAVVWVGPSLLLSGIDDGLTRRAGEAFAERLLADLRPPFVLAAIAGVVAAAGGHAWLGRARPARLA